MRGDRTFGAGATTCVFLAFVVPAFIFLRHSAVLATGAGPARGPLLVGRGDRRWRWLAWASAPRCEQTAACVLIALGVVAAVGRPLVRLSWRFRVRVPCSCSTPICTPDV